MGLRREIKAVVARLLYKSFSGEASSQQSKSCPLTEPVYAVSENFYISSTQTDRRALRRFAGCLERDLLRSHASVDWEAGL